MKISIINGSQKTGESNSGIIINSLNDIIKEKHDVGIYNLGIKDISKEKLKEIISTDVLVLVFPLFVYAMPSQTLKFLIELEKIIKQEQANNLIVYTIINNGFYEGKQNNVAFEIIKNWCEHSGVKFGGGIGQGGGEMMGRTKHIPVNKKLFNNFYQALQAIVKKIELTEPFEIMYLNPTFPKFLWKIMAVRYWNETASKNGLNIKDIKRKL
jgi:multimeric flavodoxin WrbA